MNFSRCSYGIFTFCVCDICTLTCRPKSVEGAAQSPTTHQLYIQRWPLCDPLVFLLVSKYLSKIYERMNRFKDDCVTSRLFKIFKMTRMECRKNRYKTVSNFEHITQFSKLIVWRCINCVPIRKNILIWNSKYVIHTKLIRQKSL